MGVFDKEVEIIMWGHKIKASGVYNLSELYEELQLWFTHMGYDWREIEYKKIGFPGGGYRLELVWMGIRKVDDYSTYRIKLVLAADVTDIEVTLDGGKKVKRQKATLEFRSGATILRNRDYFEDKPLGQFQLKFYEFLIRDRLLFQEGEIWGETHKLYDELKAFMLLYPH